jgi:hypothetical protein
MIGNFKKIFSTISLFRTFLRMEFNKNITLGISNFIQSSRNGFFSISKVLYDFNKNDKNHYISDWTRLQKISKINDKRRIVLDDKLIFQLINKDNPHVIPVIAVTKNNKLYRVVNNQHEHLNIEKELYDFASTFKNGLIIKPITGGGGGHISKMYAKNGTLTFKGECKNLDDFKRKVINGNRDFLITEIIKQDGICSEIFPSTLNTVRILTMIDPLSNKAFIATAVQRFGTSTLSVVDNWTAGGLSVSVNKDTGVMGLGASYPRRDNAEVKWYDSHPVTNIKILNASIPNWNYIKESILSLAETYYFLPYIGWDVVPMENGFYILEGNANSDVNLLQIHGGLLADPKSKSFYKFHKIIK